MFSINHVFCLPDYKRIETEKKKITFIVSQRSRDNDGEIHKGWECNFAFSNEWKPFQEGRGNGTKLSKREEVTF